LTDAGVQTYEVRKLDKSGPSWSGKAVNPLTIFLIAFALIICGALLGITLRKFLPGHHLADDSKDFVRLSTGLIATMAALVLGLLIASAKSSYDASSIQVQHLTVDIILIDQLLEQYGPESRPVRVILRRAIEPVIERIWRERSSPAKPASFVASAVGEDAYAKIQELSPQTDAQRSLKERAIQVSIDLAQSRLLLFEQTGNSIPEPFLAVLIFWLAIIFASFSLFTRFNPTLFMVLIIFAFSTSSAIFLILEMSEPFSGLIRISEEPLRTALHPLGP
jgi:hypothetical protein